MVGRDSVEPGLSAQKCRAVIFAAIPMVGGQNGRPTIGRVARTKALVNSALLLAIVSASIVISPIIAAVVVISSVVVAAALIIIIHPAVVVAVSIEVFSIVIGGIV